MRAQKHTGMARAGNKRSNVWLRGYKAMGPKENRDWSQDLPKKSIFSNYNIVRKLGLCTALSAKYQMKDLIIIEDIYFKEPKTKEANKIITKWGFNRPILIIDGDLLDTNFQLSSNNIKLINYIPQIGANVLDIIKNNKLILTQSAVEKLTLRLL